MKTKKKPMPKGMPMKMGERELPMMMRRGAKKPMAKRKR
jgi:hypothetical protein